MSTAAPTHAPATHRTDPRTAAELGNRLEPPPQTRWLRIPRKAPTPKAADGEEGRDGRRGRGTPHDRRAEPVEAQAAPRSGGPTGATGVGGSPAEPTRADGGHLGGAPAPDGSRGTPLVGYLVLVPEGIDPAELFAASGVAGAEPEIHPAPAEVATSLAPPVSVPSAPSASSAPSSGAGLHIDTDRHIAEVDGRRLDLTYLEFQLLAHLANHPHRVHSRAHLVTAIWGYDHVGDGRTVDVHIARLRRKLGAPYRRRIVTVRRVGYKYLPERSGAAPESR